MDTDRRARVWGLLTDEALGAGRGLSVGLVCGTAARSLPAAGVSASLMTRGNAHEVLHATDAVSGRLEELQFTLGEGPCVQAFSERAPVLVSDLEAEAGRWPMFGPTAMELGVRALFCFPLQFGAISIGVFEVYRTTAGPLSRTQLSDALILADIVSVLVLDKDTQGTGRPLRPDGDPPLSSDYHAEVYQATGMLSVQLRIGLADALARLRGNAFATGRPVSEVARDIVTGRLRLNNGDSDD